MKISNWFFSAAKDNEVVAPLSPDAFSKLYYLQDPASPFARAIIDLHDYVFMFLISVLIFVVYIIFNILRNNYYANYGPITVYEFYAKYRALVHRNKLTVLLFFPVIVLEFFYYFINYTRIRFSRFYYKLFFTEFVFRREHSQGLTKMEYYLTEGLRKQGIESVDFYRWLGDLQRTFVCYALRTYEFNKLYGGVFGRIANSKGSQFLSYPGWILAQIFIGSNIFIWHAFSRYSLSADTANLMTIMSNEHFTWSFVMNTERMEYAFIDASRFYYLALFSAYTRNSLVQATSYTHDDTLETIWTLIPSVILIFIAIPSLLVLFALDEIGRPVLTAKAIGHQWYWSYEVTITSPNSDITKTIAFDSYMIATSDIVAGKHHRLLSVDNPLYLPAYTHIRLVMTSMDVIHSWAVPSLGVKVDAIPGRLNQVGLFIDRPGVFYGQCSEICGANHGFMPIQVVALKDFVEWFNSFFMSYVSDEENVNEFSSDIVNYFSSLKAKKAVLKRSRF